MSSASTNSQQFADLPPLLSAGGHRDSNNDESEQKQPLNFSISRCDNDGETISEHFHGTDTETDDTAKAEQQKRRQARGRRMVAASRNRLIGGGWIGAQSLELFLLSFILMFPQFNKFKFGFRCP